MEDVSALSTNENECMIMPPGFRFHPTDEEIITHYLTEKVLNNNFTARAIGEVDLNKCEPWDLPKKAKMGEKEWYFFCQRDRKYPTGMRTNRATEAGYWKATGKDKEIFKGKGLVGMKKTLVFYKGRAPKGEKSNWVMHEFRLEGKLSYYDLSKATKDEWVVCRVFHKSTGIKKSPISDLLSINSVGNDVLYSPSLPPLYDPPYFNTNSSYSSFIEDNNGGSKNIATASRASDGIETSYFSSGMNDHQDNKIFPFNNHPFKHQGSQCNPPQNSVTSPHTSLSNPLLSIPGSENLGFLHQVRNNSTQNLPLSGYAIPDLAMLTALAAADEASGFKRQCKVEQLSNQSMVSQDTGLSTDVNTEISSVASKYDQMGSSGCFEDLEGPSSSGPVDLACLWNY